MQVGPLGVVDVVVTTGRVVVVVDGRVVVVVAGIVVVVVDGRVVVVVAGIVVVVVDGRVVVVVAGIVVVVDDDVVVVDGRVVVVVDGCVVVVVAGRVVVVVAGIVVVVDDDVVVVDGRVVVVDDGVVVVVVTPEQAAMYTNWGLINNVAGPEMLAIGATSPVAPAANSSTWLPALTTKMLPDESTSMPRGEARPVFVPEMVLTRVPVGRENSVIVLLSFVTYRVVPWMASPSGADTPVGMVRIGAALLGAA